MNWFHKCYENLITDSYLNSKIILFSASLRTFEHCSAWTEQKVSFVSLQLSRNSLTVLRSSSAFFFGVFVLLLFGKWIYMVLAYHNKSCNYGLYLQFTKFSGNDFLPYRQKKSFQVHSQSRPVDNLSVVNYWILDFLPLLGNFEHHCL